MVSVALSGAAAAKPRFIFAKAYVDGIYRALPEDGFDYRKVRYAPILRALIAKDDRIGAAIGGVNLIDAVPFCECQDTDIGYHFETRGVATASGATVHIRLTNGSTQNFSIDLVPLAGRWAIADIHGPSIHSFTAYLRRNLSRTR
jgi:hypothetical protein